ncbi:MAG: hypothetical protein QGG23_02520 [Candidatus Bathyarchaeota archaeon]|jgi:hypothetical protein|nr:hypothetical protein [Candidatus Bathyarchaeota archaeon]MDP7207179.1 hypothetical protein [Candidatus Bathyarchaeota archaeon]MDP7443649.1 hypothetical protein [Candidatus Bathyarchaeota archaeon]|tara:strand:+ start:2789 stop:3490 length:702 start_codon:yes stop_codon:yes gene_type:complete
MVLPAKTFEIREKISLAKVYEKLQAFREEEDWEGEEVISLLTEVLDLELAEDSIKGVFARDYVKPRHYKRKMVETPVTEEAPFWVKPYEKRTFLIVVAPSVARGVKKLLTNHVANKVSEILFGVTGAIVEVRIPDEILMNLHESNPQATRLIWFDNVDIPGVNKLCLAGESLADTGLYKDYKEHGKIWYVVFGIQKRGITVGVSRNCVVTLFSKSSLDEFIRYLTDDFFSLID